ncbi:hypothetical protein, partial [Vibrio harveyi]|uniref:hypothetical protein n=1 Tax=Vibrio harveyi TaxID=669 RepID=UPI001A7F04CD
MNPTHINKTLTAIVSGDRQVNTVKVPNNPKLIDTSQPVTPKEVINSPHFRLQQLLTNLPALQRFVALLTSLSGTPAPSHSPVQQWLPQL